MKRKVLQLIGSFHQGGSELQAIALSRLLKTEGSFDVFAATLSKEGILRNEVEAIGLPEIPEFPLTSFYNANFIRQLRLFVKYLKDSEIDIVHTHDFYTNIFGMAAARFAGVKAKIASKRETGDMRSRSQDMIERAAFRSANAIVVNSLSVQTYLVDRGVPSRKTSLIYNGLDLDNFKNEDHDISSFLSSNKLPQGDGIRLIAMVANLRHHVKNVPMLLRAAKKVSDINRCVHFVVAGEGELENELCRQAEQLGISENVHFIGRCSNVPTLLAASYACVLTSTAEGFSNSIIEYMAAAKPVVVTNVGGAAEAVKHGENGFLVESDDDEALATHLNDLLDDPAKAMEFGANGKRIATANFSAVAQLNNTLDLYSRLLR